MLKTNINWTTWFQTATLVDVERKHLVEQAPAERASEERGRRLFGDGRHRQALRPHGAAHLRGGTLRVRAVHAL